MQDSDTRGLGDVVRIPLKQYPGCNVLARRVPMTLTWAWAWEKHIQGFIRKESDRADRWWHWPSIFWGLQPYIRFNGWNLDAWVYVLPVPGKDEALPIGMVYCLSGFPAIQNPTQPSEYLWFLAGAPNRALYAKGIYGQPSVGKRALLDVLTLSLGDRATGPGNVGLHAAKVGGDRLLDFYDKFGLLPLDPRARLPMWFRPNDRRYFFSDFVNTAEILSRKRR